MKFYNTVIDEYINYFFSRIVGFEHQSIKYAPMSQTNNEFVAIAMDKIDRLTRTRGKLRTRVWSNCYFIFHGSEIDPTKVFAKQITEIKKRYPFLFVRSYVYFIFVNISKTNQSSLLGDPGSNIKTNDYKVWLFNSKYEIKEETRRTNIFGITLNESEVVSDYIYLANPESELRRMESANSDAIDCVRAFTGDLKLLEQTSEMLDVVRAEFERNPKARVLVEGPARSGKTIIAATLLGEYEDSKFLLMNYFFYQAIVDGFYALSDWKADEIEALIGNPELDAMLCLKNAMPGLLKRISKNLEYAIHECRAPKPNSQTKRWLIDNISEMADGFARAGFGKKDLFGFKSLTNLKESLSDSSDSEPFTHIHMSNLKKLKSIVDGLLSGKYDSLVKLQEKIAHGIEELVVNSRQRFFHHNINRKISTKVRDGCWIERGNPTVSKMWSKEWHPQLVICDEVQRLGLISEYGNYDEFDEVREILNHSSQSFFTGDDFQMLNSKYDKGVENIKNIITVKGESLTRYNLPESVGVPAEVGVLMKYLTNPQAIEVDEVVKGWKQGREFEVILIDQNADLLVTLLDEDKSNKKHIASPIDYDWLGREDKIQIDTRRRENPIIALNDHDKENFAYTFPYFCNEEIMPNYILSAYELISREVESLYVHIPRFSKMRPIHDKWYRKHLYVLFTRPTARLVVNFDVHGGFEDTKRLVTVIRDAGAKVSVSFFGKETVSS